MLRTGEQSSDVTALPSLEESANGSRLRVARLKSVCGRLSGASVRPLNCSVRLQRISAHQ